MTFETSLSLKPASPCQALSESPPATLKFSIRPVSSHCWNAKGIVAVRLVSNPRPPETVSKMHVR